MFGLFKRATANTVSPPELRDLLDRQSVTLVDVREGSEWAQGHIPGAVHLPLSRLRQDAPGIAGGKPVVFYCLSGARSGQAVALCRTLGLPHDTHLAGGIGAWRAHGLPITR